MPAYDYRCRDCDTRIEVRRGLDEPEAPVACPSCQGATSRVWTAVSVGAAAGSSPAPAAPSGGGGCCGGGCCG